MSEESTIEYVAAGPAAGLPPGEMRVYTVAGLEILIANCDGVYHAIEDRCSHDDGPLGEGWLSRCQVECPRHGARFDLATGRALTLPAFRPVGRFDVRVDPQGMIEVAVPVV